MIKCDRETNAWEVKGSQWRSKRLGIIERKRIVFLMWWKKQVASERTEEGMVEPRKKSHRAFARALRNIAVSTIVCITLIFDYMHAMFSK